MKHTDPSELTPMGKARLRRGWTLRELAEKCIEQGVSASYNNLARIERGKGVPYPKLRAVLAELLDLDAAHDFPLPRKAA